MNTHVPSLSLFEDWQRRRQYLVTETSSTQCDATLRVLNYLLERYAEDNQVQRPARFPFSSAIVFNERRIFVFHHLHRAGIHDSSNKAEAERHVQSVLTRMHSPEADTKSDDADSLFPSISDEVDQSIRSWRSAIRMTRYGLRVDQSIRAALRKNPCAPRTIIRHLCERIQDTGRADIEA